MKKYLFILLGVLFIGILFVSCVKDDGLEPPPPPEPGEAVLMYYWHFNELPGGTLTEPIEADYTLFGLGGATISYPGEGAGYVDTRTHREADPVSNFNLRQGQMPDMGAVLRLRNPSAEREGLFIMPTTGYKDLVLTFATTRTENGNQTQQIQVSADGGSNWTNVGDSYYVNCLPENEGYVEKVVDLSDFEELNNNANTRIRIIFIGEGNTNDSGNNRFDNVSLDGVAVE